MACGNTLSREEAVLARATARVVSHPLARDHEIAAAMARDLASGKMTAMRPLEVLSRTAELGDYPPGVRETFVERLGGMSERDQASVGRLLSDEVHATHDIIKGFGNPKLDPEMAKLLPASLHDIRAAFPNAGGLFDTLSYERGPGQTSWIRDLGNRGNKNQANGSAAEVLVAHRMLAAGRRLGDPPLRASGRGGPVPDVLRIFSTDDVHFGQKLQARYGTSFGATRKTVEADILISRSDLFGVTTDILVDVKHHTDAVNLTPDYLEGLKTAIQTGEIDAAHVVATGKFDVASQQRVSEANKAIAEALGRAGERDYIQLHPYVGWQ